MKRGQESRPAWSDPSEARAQITRRVLFRSVTAGLLVVLVSVGGVLRRLDRQVLDHRLRVLDRAAAQAGDTRSRFVSVVDCPAEQVSAWTSGAPGSRAQLAELVRRLHAAGARAIVLDFPLHQPSEDDETLADALRQSGKAIVRCTLTSLEPTQFTLTRPRPAFSRAVAGLGFSLWEPQHDAIVRHFLTTLEGGVELSLPVATWAQLHGYSASQVFYDLFHRGRLPGTSLRLEPEKGVPMYFCGPPGAGFQTFRVERVLRGDNHVLAGRVVVVGTLDVAAGGWTVPLATSLRPEWIDRRPLYMSGTELTATAIDTLLSGRVIRPLGPIGGLLLAIAFAVAAGFTARLARPPLAALGVLMGLVAWYVGADLLFAWRLVSLPLFEPYAAAMLSFGLSVYGRLVEQAELAARAADASERERRRLAELDTAKRAVLGTVVHDLKVPVSIIKAQSVTLASDPDRELGAEVHQEFLETMASQCDRLMHQIEDLLDTDSQRPVLLQRQAVDLGALLDRVVAMHRSALPNHPITVDVSELPPLSLDAEKIERVFDNLLSNAIKYSPDGGPVQITARLDRAAQQVSVAVRDWGMGMTDAQQARLFGLFVRVLDEPQKIAGSGIGLYSARRLVEAHGGEIQVQSAPGAGSTFTVVLPFLPAAHRAA